MSGHTSTVGQRADSVSADDSPHEDYYDSGVPVLLNTDFGQLVARSVHAYTIYCPECRVPAVYDERSEPICPECGLVCGGQSAVDEARLISDPKAAGRVDSDGNLA